MGQSKRTSGEFGETRARNSHQKMGNCVAQAGSGNRQKVVARKSEEARSPWSYRKSLFV